MMTRRLSLVIASLAMVFGFFIVGPQTTLAQEFSLYSADDIFVETIPNVPGPNEQVTLKLDSYSFNLNNYYIAWFKDGERQSAGYGQREFKFRTGASGVITNVTAVVEFEGQVFRKELRFAPSQVDLLWQAIDAYVPPFYRGKALPLKQSQVRITAIPETLLIEPNDAPNLVYYWDRNYQRQGDQSGFGRQSITFTADPLVNSEKITVTSNDRRENSAATNTIDIPVSSFSPKILFYEIDQNDRILTNQALNTNGVVDGDTIKLSFHPLNMSSIKDNFTDLFVDWRINGTPGPPQDFAKQNELYITTSGVSGATSISVGLEGIEKLLQKTREGIELVFNAGN